MKVTSIAVSGARVQGVETETGPITADRVIAAAGARTAPLLAALGLDIGLSTSPARLLRFSAPSAFI